MSRTQAAALIVDSDPKGLEPLVYGFQDAGWRITACPTPETASLLVKASGAQLVVAASRRDHDKVHAMVKQLRAREAFRSLPVLVLGPEELRGELKQHGQTDLLPLPALVRDVLTASQVLVGDDTATAPRPGDQTSFEDSITAQTSLSLVRTMKGLARSGSMHLARKGRHGEILFHEGQLTAAQVGQLQGMAAVQHMLVWNDGRVELRLRPVVRRGQLRHTARELLDELERFQRDYSHAIKDIGPHSAVYLVNHERLHASTGAIPAEVTPVVRLCDGQRTLGDVIDESPFRVLDTVRILARLVELAVLNRRDAKPVGGSEEASALETFWRTARITIEGAAQDGARHSQPMPVQVDDPSMQKTPPPIETKPRPGRQTQEIGQPAEPLASGPEASFASVPTNKPVVEWQSNVRTDVSSSKPIEAARRSTPAFGTGISGLRPSPARGVPLVGATAPTNAQTSGAFELRKPRPSQPTMHTAEARRSVVIDTALVEVVAPGPAAIPSTTPLAEAAPGAAETEATTKPSAAEPTAATVASAGLSPPSVSVERRTSPTDEPKTPLVETVPVAEVKKETGARVTGEMRVVSSGRSHGPIKAGVTTSSFQIDPSLASDVPAQKPDPPRESAPGPLPNQGTHRPSGSFSAIESDFFEREADLYKVDKTESFADLDEGKGKSGGKSKAAGAPLKRK